METLQSILQGSILDPATLTGAFLLFVIIGILVWLIVFVIRLLIKVALRIKIISVTQGSFLRRFLPVFLYIAAAIFYIALIPSLDDIKVAIFASAGAISIIIGLAAQNTLGNIIAGFALIIYRPFEIGNSVRIQTPLGEDSGVIEKLRLGYTIIRTTDERRIIVPNSIMSNTVTINLTKVDPRVMAVITFDVSNSIDIDRARQIIIELAKADPRVLEIVRCPVTELDNPGICLTLYAWCKDNHDVIQVRWALNESVVKAFDREGIKTPQVNGVVLRKTN